MTASSGFPPVSNRHARVLILGSLPGRRSIEMAQYYAQPRNAFWPIMGELFSAGPELAYDARLRRLRSRGIALWDVLAAADRPGSLDSAIVRSSMQVNDVPAFLAAHPRIECVFFNGAKAAELYRRTIEPQLGSVHAGLRYTRLPSTSPAHAAMPFAVKLECWSAVERCLPARRSAHPRCG